MDKPARPAHHRAMTAAPQTPSHDPQQRPTTAVGGGGLPVAAMPDLLACPRCDALQRAVLPPPGGHSRCVRCSTVLIAPHRAALGHVLLLSVTGLILMLAAIFLPFIDITAGGLSSRSSVFDAAMAFSDGALAPLSVAVLAMIVLVPLARVVLTLWALAPLALGRAPLPGARAAFRLDEELKPWAMTEIFIIGVSIALVKIADLATVSLGPAFWLFGALVAVGVLQDGLLDRWTAWRALEGASGSHEATPVGAGRAAAR